jgi:hypothetical protein
VVCLTPSEARAREANFLQAALSPYEVCDWCLKHRCILLRQSQDVLLSDSCGCSLCCDRKNVALCCIALVLGAELARLGAMRLAVAAVCCGFGARSNHLLSGSYGRVQAVLYFS